MGRVDGKVALVTGAAQGQGQAHCLRLAEEGADIIGIDLCEQLDIVVANAAICTIQTWDEVTERIWGETIDINLTGVWHTLQASIPHLIASGGRSIVLTSSAAGLKGLPFLTPYVVAKHGLVGLARTLANELADENIRVNTVHPTGVDTPMGYISGGNGVYESKPLLGPIFMNTLAVDRIDPVDIANAVLFLVSDEAAT